MCGAGGPDNSGAFRSYDAFLWRRNLHRTRKTMGSDADARSGEADPEPQSADQQDQEEPIGGEIRVGQGGTPSLIRWTIYLLHIWAVVYLLVHPSVPHREILLALGALVGAWLVFFALTKRPPEL